MRVQTSRIIVLILVFVLCQSFSSSFLISDQGTISLGKTLIELLNKEGEKKWEFEWVGLLL